MCLAARHKPGRNCVDDTGSPSLRLVGPGVGRVGRLGWGRGGVLAWGLSAGVQGMQGVEGVVAGVCQTSLKQFPSLEDS